MFISLPSQSNPIQDVYHRLNQLQERVQNVYHRSDQFQPVWNVRGEFPLGAHPATPPFTATINLEATTDHLSILSRTPLCNTIRTNTPLLPSYTLSRTSLCWRSTCEPPVFSSGLFVENNCPAPILVVPPWRSSFTRKQCAPILVSSSVPDKNRLFPERETERGLFHAAHFHVYESTC